MSEKFYQYVIYSLLSMTALFSVFLIASDVKAPFTTQASVSKAVAQIAPEVSGVVTQVAVHNGQRVTQGELLFSIDAKPYQLALSQAHSQLESALQANQTTLKELEIARATLKERQIQQLNADRNLKRLQALGQHSLVSKAKLDDATQQAELAATAVDMAKASIDKLQLQYQFNGHNSRVDAAKNAVAQAQLQLSKTQVLAGADGVVTNLQLSAGTFISKGSTAMLMTEPTHDWINADFNERGLPLLQAGAQALVVFDAYPGKVFPAKLSNLDDAVFDPSNTQGKLAVVVNNNRWIREHQNIRARLTVGSIENGLISGSKASVMLLPAKGVWHYVASGWMSLLSYLRYLY
ncbi:hemolysin D [Shewanella sp. NFH-SH190041]|uniref:HlyD family secretion protein n=1 Tax=Shewanella sp. NFH-SH190041 TaxID=2950245 RepID=UPI0021C48DD9|nr:HlyD family secretion protein [Shewanella sp. NFH-SH190041]BDM65294.1 hemolysin D [Shewanella sp. NFH-SH190041]